MFNFDFNPNDLQDVKNTNTRVNYDLRFSEKTEKFTLSQDAYNRFDIANNGFNIKKTPNGDIVLQLAENEEANIHAGKSGSVKGNTFTARSLVDLLDITETTSFKMHSQEIENTTFIALESLTDSPSMIEDEEENNTSEETETEIEYNY